MDTAKLARRCRCGHARRFHQQGTIWEGYSTQCLSGHPPNSEYGPVGCHYFEAAEGWQESYAKLLRSEGYVVELVRRDERGRFLPAPEQARA